MLRRQLLIAASAYIEMNINESQISEDDGDLALLRVILGWLLLTQGALTVATHLAQIAAISFRTYALISSFLISGSLLFFTLSRGRPRLVFDKTTRREILRVCVLGCLGATLALVINRADIDDYYYLPNAVYYLNHPTAAMGYQVHGLYNDGTSFTSLSWATAGAFEYTQAAVAYITGLPFLTVYYVLAVGLTGFLIPVTTYLLMSQFCGTKIESYVGPVAVLGLILLLGETHRAFGNVSFARPYQGKIVLLAVCLPLFSYYSCRFFSKPRLTDWCSLFFLNAVMVGMSASAVFLAPALAITLSFAHLVANRSKATCLRTCFYLAASAYTAVYGAYLLKQASAHLGANSAANWGWPTSFEGHLMFLINPHEPVTVVTFALSLVIALIWLPRKKMLLLFGWVLGAFLIFLNPIVSAFFIEHVTSPNAYWRLFYILPFPLVCGIAIAAIFNYLTRCKVSPSVAFVLIFGALLAPHFFAPASSILRGPDRSIGLPAYKVASADLNCATQLVSTIPPGLMLAPSNIAGTIGMISPHYPQLRIREDAERVWLASLGRGAEAELRIQASEYLAGNGSDISALESLLALFPQINTVVLIASVFEKEPTKTLLVHHHFTNIEKIDGYVAVYKEQGWRNSQEERANSKLIVESTNLLPGSLAFSGKLGCVGVPAPIQ